MNELWKALIDVDEEPIVICDMEHRIVYMNPIAIKRYENRGGEKLIGQSIFECHNAKSREIILAVCAKFAENPDLNKVYTYTKDRDGVYNDVYMVALRKENGELIGYYEKHESRIREADR
ncbi:MAG: PAS domain-containing protein [Clostridiales bacterium]|nr:PAS domain-containing protein [Clostridiales bacterium]MCC8105320.1 PAS domain-containing protein [Clostridiales bacterium]